MKNNKGLLAIALFLLAYPLSTWAQSGEVKPVEMADGMRANGMLYVVVAVVLTILFGLLFYVYRVDRKVTRLEKGNR